VGSGTLIYSLRPDIFPLAESFAAVRRAFERDSKHRRRLAAIFNCG
jgi:hypothetical protein